MPEVRAKLNYYLSSEIWVVDRSLSEGCKVALEQNKIKSGNLDLYAPNAKKAFQENRGGIIHCNINRLVDHNQKTSA